MNKQDILDKIKCFDALSNDEKAYLVNLVNTKKKYGLVWEDKPEDVEEELRTKLPILKEVKERAIINDTDTEKHPNHILIEGDNLHALTTLTFTHEGKIDLIYIDPPYNTGNKDFIYNDNYVDKEDGYRHSKWLSFMAKRLEIAKSLLTPCGVMAISIGYQELHNLVPICEEIFYNKQVVTVTVQTSGGKPSGGFNYLQEYIVFITPIDFIPNPVSFAGGKSRSPFEGLTLSTFNKTQRPNQVYPIFIDKITGGIWGCGNSLTSRVNEGEYVGETKDFNYDFQEAPEGTVALWPITSKGKECVWRLIPKRLMKDWKDGFIKVSPNKSKSNPNEYSVQYLPDGVIKKIKNGELEVVGTEKSNPTLVFGTNLTVGSDIPTIWSEKAFFTTKGSGLLKEMFDDSKFSYPKPVELVSEIIRAASNKESIVLDFFAGSGTTCHAAMMINDIEGERRQCIMVTNNESNICEDVTYERFRKVNDGYVNSKQEHIDGLISNNLRYYICDSVDRDQSLVNKRNLTRLATELLCIKENCYQEITSQLLNADWHKFFTNGNGEFVYVVYDDMYIEDAVEALKAFIKKNPKILIKVFVFSNGQYAYAEEFEDVADNITLAALPDAIYKAFQNILPKENKEFIHELEEVSTVELDQE